MLMMLMLLNIILSMNFMFMIHPLSMGLILLLQTLMISLITGYMNFNYWFSYILFLIMIGGMLVLFIYMTSIASNEKFKFNNKLMLLSMTLIFTSIILTWNIDNMMMMNNMFNLIFNNFNNYLMLSKFYNKPSNLIMFMMIIYLFISLIAVVKITEFNLGPLRQNF
uniref:NADH-ubiquinone oxidoreductase chain 6 n=1 Tax=Ochthebius minoicus TaxID=2769891 RepID=A0A7H0DK51_9COLE|nr:NADH dehydrogenase subunit 6 [Ochthebius minoicus]QNP09711.1 NADH dehydrogenase subunit 6 [Ochthebius minoicus]